MKNNKNLLSVLVVLFSMISLYSCKDDAPVYVPAEKQTGGDQVFMYEDTPLSITVTPNKKSFEMTFGRKNESQAVTVDLQVIDKDNMFDVPALSFAAGEKTKKIVVGVKLPTTKSSELTVVIPKSQSYLYGSDSITIAVKNDYTWLDAGAVDFTSAWAGTTAEIKIQGAKENPGLYRLLDVYYVLEPAYAPKKGYHLEITLDENYNAVSLPVRFNDIGEAASTGGWWFLYWNPAQYGKFYNTGNEYTIEGAWASSDAAGTTTLKSLAKESFVWTKEYPLAQ